MNENSGIHFAANLKDISLQQDGVFLLTLKGVKDICKDGGIFKKIIAISEKWENPKDLDEVLVKYEAWFDEGTLVAKSDGGVHYQKRVYTNKTAGGGTSINVSHGSVGVHTNKPSRGGTAMHVGYKGSVGVSTRKPGHRTDVHIGNGGASVGIGSKIGPSRGPFKYDYSATEAQLHDDPKVAFFFLEKDLSPGTKMNLHFTKTTNGAVFLPRQVANSIPFSSEKIPAILDRFSVEPESQEAEIMKQTIKECEEKGIKGEDKYCATSLESMVDYATSKLGKSVKVISTEADRETEQEKFVVARAKKISGSEAVAALNTEAYSVALVGQDGTKVKVTAVCHKDTSWWNPKHLAFQVLHVRPGSVPVCHFLYEDEGLMLKHSLADPTNDQISTIMGYVMMIPVSSSSMQKRNFHAPYEIARVVLSDRCSTNKRITPPDREFHSINGSIPIDAFSTMKTFSSGKLRCRCSQ
ncbi:hypothetical protein Nepgr_008830 [Nepenthes gracilis]|uniref:BURP domain-containing protein n=1 Tax=Nepenthes gracilis TaxID=150966 RepID=A0AAD3XJR9_NEPGR|nr:hypothetical protein Nepgr_008830 [Nepenthes gracilis]